MRRLTSTRLWVAVLVFGAAFALTSVNSGNDSERIPALVKQLGNEDFHTREAATKELRTIGEPALPALVAASNSDDPEVRSRAQWLLPLVMRAAGKSKSTGLEMAPVRVREFMMGSPKDEPTRRADESPQHAVWFTKTFLLGVHEVTQDEYRTVMKTEPSWFSKTGGGKEKIGKLDTGRFPVEQVTWFDAIDFCNRLGALDGFEPYYKLADQKREDGVLKTAAVTVAGGNGYRLPTEAEWEFACRCGTDTAFYFGRRATTGREGNFKSQFPGGYGGDVTVFLGRSTAVGSYPRTRLGQHDLHGNVAEWCWDWYDKDYYANSPRANPTGPAKGTHRVVRGGSWLVENTSCRSAARGSQLPTDATYTTGFRVARSPY